MANSLGPTENVPYRKLGAFRALLNVLEPSPHPYLPLCPRARFEFILENGLLAQSSANQARLAAVMRSAAQESEVERALCERASSGDRAALAELLRLHGPRLYRSVLLPRLGSVAAAEDALSQTYLKVVERMGQFSWQSVGFYPWLRSVGLHVAIDALRKRQRETLFEPADLERELELTPHEPRDAKALEERDLAMARRRVESLLDRLNPRYALAIRLRVLEQRPREEVAKLLDVNIATFDVVLHRAMAALKKIVSEAEEVV